MKSPVSSRRVGLSEGLGKEFCGKSPCESRRLVVVDDAFLGRVRLREGKSMFGVPERMQSPIGFRLC